MRGLLYQNTLEELGDGYIARIKDSNQGGKRIGGFKAFPRRMFPNIVILPQNVRELKINGQFMLFHELGHLGINHRRALDAGLQTIAGLFYIGAVAFGFLPPWYAMSLLIVLGYLWYGSVTVASIHAGRKTGNLEKFADSFAFFMLRNHPEINKLKESFQRTSAKEKTRDSMDYYAWWFKD